MPEKDWIRTLNAHEPIIDMETWNKVQSILEKHYKPTKTKEKILFICKICLIIIAIVFLVITVYTRFKNNLYL